MCFSVYLSQREDVVEKEGEEGQEEEEEEKGEEES